jgi:DNA polymerase/3'-5' exonuclease PolX
VKEKFPREKALKVADEIYKLLLPYCERLKVAGSLRRGLSHVSDIEFLAIPQYYKIPVTLFGDETKVDLVDEQLNKWITAGYISKRLSVRDTECWGPFNKLAVHTDSGIPVDFFSTSPEKWWNALVVRTGGKRSNLALTMAANKKGYSFEAYGSGFHKLTDHSKRVEMGSEKEIFDFVGLPYWPPNRRK